MKLKSMLASSKSVFTSLGISKTKATNIVLAVLVVSAVFGTLFYFAQTGNVFRTGSDFLAGVFTGILEKEVQEEVQEEVSEFEETKEIVQGDYIKEARAGEGLTHIARRAIDRYLDEQGDDLNAERRVFAEDYIQKTLGGGELFLGEEVLVSQELISEAINLSFELESEQLENLKNYSLLVSSFN